MRHWSLVLFSIALLSKLSAISGDDVGSIITPSLLDQMLKHRNAFYTYNAFVNAARSFNGFGTTGDITTRKRELATFFGQTSHETTGGWPAAPDGPYAWGYYFIREQGGSGRYYGRGPTQLTHDYNYRKAGQAIKVDLINNPDLVATDASSHSRQRYGSG